jgi:hypothetical protein
MRTDPSSDRVFPDLAMDFRKAEVTAVPTSRDPHICWSMAAGGRGVRQGEHGRITIRRPCGGRQANCPFPETTMKDETGRLTSEGLAVLIVDALVDGGLVEKENFDKALEIATEEIEVRKACGDY